MTREKVRRWEYSRDKVRRREKKKKMGVENNFVIYGTMEKGKGVKGGGEGQFTVYVVVNNSRGGPHVCTVYTVHY